MKINILLASVLILASYSALSFLAISELKELQQNDFQTKFIRYGELNHKIRNLCIGMTRDPEKCEDFFQHNGFDINMPIYLQIYKDFKWSDNK